MKRRPSPGAHARARRLRRDMTEAERCIWRMLRLQQMSGYKFRRQVPLGRYIADFVCQDARLIVEIDGGQHDPASSAEIARSEFLRREGYSILRFWNNEVLTNLDGVCTVIAAALGERVLDGPRSTPTQTLPRDGEGGTG